MTEQEEYYFNRARIEAITNTLLFTGYLYDNMHGWYAPDNLRPRKDQKEYFENAKPLLKELVKRNNYLRKKYGFK
jgi:hypothetical protein